MQPNLRRTGRGLARGLARLRSIVSRPAFQVAALLAGLVMFYWPMLAGEAAWSGPQLFHYLFGAWAVLVVLLMLIGWGQPPAERRGPPGPDRPE